MDSELIYNSQNKRKIMKKINNLLNNTNQGEFIMNKETKQLIKNLEKAVEEGDVKALYDLGQAYDSMGDFNKSFYWYQKSAEQGNLCAQLQISIMYGLGEGIKKDSNKSISCIQKLAEFGFDEAQLVLSNMYEIGVDNIVEQDFSKAYFWLKKAADQGRNMLAIIKLQSMREGFVTDYYENGQKRKEATYEYDREEGASYCWHANGQKAFEVNFKKGQFDGHFIAWHCNGQKESETIYKNGKLDGLLTEWDETGKVLSANIYKNGKKVSTQSLQAA